MTQLRPRSEGPSRGAHRALPTFFVLVFALSVPFLVFGAVTGRELMPNLPIAAAPRVVLVWIHNNAGRSVFAAALSHMSVNVTWQLFRCTARFWINGSTA